MKKRLLTAFAAVLIVALGIGADFNVNVLSDMVPTRWQADWIPWTASLVGLVILGLLIGRLRDRPPTVAQLLDVPEQAAWVPRRELDIVLRQLLQERSGTVALTAALLGAGGLGKTALARAICHDPKVQRRFSGGVVWVTVGRERTGADLADLVAAVAARIGGIPLTTSDPTQAGFHLAGVLVSRGPLLLVIDDIWDEAQLEVFLYGAPDCVRLVTTRNPGVVPRGASTIEVDQMDVGPAGQLLGMDLPRLNTVNEQELLELTGSWPLSLVLVNATLRDRVRHGADLETAAAEVVARLREAGPTALDATDTSSRDKAVRATIEYSLESLGAGRREWYLQLGVFAEDIGIPCDVIALLWGVSPREATDVCRRLARFSLLSIDEAASPTVLLHDVIRQYARAELGPARRQATHRVLVEGARACLDVPAKGAATPWWQLSEEHTYLLRHLAYHLAGAGLSVELASLACNVRWLDAKILAHGPAAAESDLALAGTPLAKRLADALAQCAHVLQPVEPAHALTATLLSRLRELVPELIEQIDACAGDSNAPLLECVWPLPDLTAQQIRTLPRHPAEVTGVAISSDCTWLATAARDGIVRLWGIDGTDLGKIRVPTRDMALGVAISPDDRWLLTLDVDGRVHLWGADGGTRGELHGHLGGVAALAISPDGSWLATVGCTGGVRLWNCDGTHRGELIGSTRGVMGVAISPDGTWLATVDAGGAVRLWDMDGQHRTTLIPGDTETRTAAGQRAHIIKYVLGQWSLVTHPRSRRNTWDKDLQMFGRATRMPKNIRRALATNRRIGRRMLAEAGRHGQPGRRPPGWGVAVIIAEIVRLLLTPSRDQEPDWLDGGDGWDFAERADQSADQVWLARITRQVGAIAIAPSGDWLAAYTADGYVRLWNIDGSARATLGGGYTIGVRNVSITPEGTRLATVDYLGPVDVWSDTGEQIFTIPVEEGDGFMLFEPSSDRVFADLPSGVGAFSPDGSMEHMLLGGIKGLHQLSFAPDRSCFVTYEDDIVHLWRADEASQVSIPWTAGVNDVAIAPDGSWLATAHKDSPGKVQLRNADGSERVTLEQVTVDRSDRLAIAPDGSWLAVLDRDQDHYRLGLWDTDGTCRAALPDDMVWTRLKIAANSEWLITSHPGAVRLWNADGSIRQTIIDVLGIDEIDLLYRNITISDRFVIAPNASWLLGYSSARSSPVNLWNADGSIRGSTDELLGPFRRWQVVIASDSRWFVRWDLAGLHTYDSAGHPRFSKDMPGCLGVVIAPDSGWLACDRRLDWFPHKWWQRERLGRRDAVQLLNADGTERALITGARPVISPTGKWLITRDSNTLWIWNADGTSRQRIVGPSGWTNLVAIAPDGSHLAACNSLGTLWIVDSADGSRTAGIRIDGLVDGLGWFPDSRHMYAIGSRGLYGFVLANL